MNVLFHLCEIWVKIYRILRALDIYYNLELDRITQNRENLNWKMEVHRSDHEEILLKYVINKFVQQILLRNEIS